MTPFASFLFPLYILIKRSGGGEGFIPAPPIGQPTEGPEMRRNGMTYLRKRCSKVNKYFRLVSIIFHYFRFGGPI
jgi:hypothetical protein